MLSMPAPVTYLNATALCLPPPLLRLPQLPLLLHLHSSVSSPFSHCPPFFLATTFYLFAPSPCIPHSYCPSHMRV